MNLLTDDWLRVIGADGRILPLSPPRIGSGEIRDLHAPRADFRGALYQFLIGLLQTACTPENRKAWLAWWRTPPSTDELKKRFAPFLDAFELISENGRPAFMQDLDMPDGEPKQIATLLIDAPGGKTLRDNLDHFVKRGTVEKISPHWAATALFTLQINAPSGGVGHRVSLRGGGPLTTLVLPPEGGDRDTLWHRLWLNVLTGEELARLPGNGALKNQSAIFPWLATTRTSGKKGSETWPEQVHPLQVFWCMPRRIRLDAPDREGGICDLDGRPATALLHGYRTRNHGINYAGSWEHPLTPYVREAGKENLTIKGQPGGLGYRHWLGLVVEESAGKQHRVPATVVRAWQQSR
ncbi:MAG TPA: type I-E CRISPR-associated protein Cse1/CasA, partial [Sedimenticola sp.]|nr:type I-E CRISPR-associated protein Cse1/CasA [Sedimenticola sp.]